MPIIPMATQCAQSSLLLFAAITRRGQSPWWPISVRSSPLPFAGRRTSDPSPGWPIVRQADLMLVWLVFLQLLVCIPGLQYRACFCVPNTGYVRASDTVDMSFGSSLKLQIGSVTVFDNLYTSLTADVVEVYQRLTQGQ